MPPFRLRSSIPSYVLLLESPSRVYRDLLEGHQRSRFDGQVAKFLTGEPESAFRDASKFPAPIRQLKDRGGNVRALGTWCQTSSFDLLVIQALYRKPDERQFLERQQAFAERGSSLRERFESISHDDLRSTVREWRAREDLTVLTEDDV